MDSLAGFLIFIAAGAGAADPSYVTAAELEGAAAQVREGVGASSPVLAGRRFRLTIVPRERGEAHSICDGYPSWGWYRKEAQFEMSGEEGKHDGEFFLDAHGAPAVAARSPADSIHLTSFACTYRREAKRQVENMYGEMVEHEPTYEDVLAIAHVSRADPESHWFEARTDEAGARALGERIVVRITGTLGEWLPGRPIVCGADNYDSLGAPVLVGDFSGCLINGRVELVEYVDSVSGEVLLAKRLGPERQTARR